MARSPIVTIDDLLQFDLEDLRRLWVDLPEIYQWALVTHPRTPPLLLWNAVKTSRVWAWRLGWVRDEIPQELVWDLFLYQTLEIGGIDGHLVRHPSVPPELLEVLAELGDLGVRGNLLDHKNVTDRVLRRLTHDPDRDIRRHAAKRLRARRGLRRLLKQRGPRP